MPAVDPLEHAEIDVPPVFGAQLQTSCASDSASISAAMQQAFGRLMPYIARNKLVPAGPPRAIYSDFAASGTRFTLALPLANATAATANPEEGLTSGLLPCGRMHRFTHRGPYSELAKTYSAITTWMQQAKLMKDASDWMQCSPMWEEYISDPANTPPADLVTYIYVPVPRLT